MAVTAPRARERDGRPERQGGGRWGLPCRGFCARCVRCSATAARRRASARLACAQRCCVQHDRRRACRAAVSPAQELEQLRRRNEELRRQIDMVRARALLTHTPTLTHAHARSASPRRAAERRGRRKPPPAATKGPVSVFATRGDGPLPAPLCPRGDQVRARRQATAQEVDEQVVRGACPAPPSTAVPASTATASRVRCDGARPAIAAGLDADGRGGSSCVGCCP